MKAVPKKFLFLNIALVLAASIHGFSQNSRLEWQKTIGEKTSDYGKTVIQTRDGGYLFGTEITSGNRPGFHGYADIWLVKTDASGNAVWDRCYGGSNYEVINAVAETDDGGFVIAATTTSIDGDISGAYDTSGKLNDIWVYKIDGSGKLIWQKIIGGSNSDVAAAILVADDGKILVAGNTSSNDKDVSGNHQNSGSPTVDMLLAELDSNGNLIWQKCYGGTNNEQSFSIDRMNDGSYLLLGTTQSIDGDVNGMRGQRDGFLVKLDSAGSILKSRCIGGSGIEYVASFAQKPGDSGFMLLMNGTSKDGDFVDVPAIFKYNLFRLDSDLNIKWMKYYGGSRTEQAKQIVSLSNGGYVLAGTSTSTDGDINANVNYADKQGVWLLEVDDNGEKVQSLLMGGSRSDYVRSIIATNDGGYMFIGETLSTDGTLSGRTAIGEEDIWIVKMTSKPLAVPVTEGHKTTATVFPTSTQGMVNVHFDRQMQATLNVFNTCGALIAEKSISGHSASVDLSNQPAGIYFLTVMGKDVRETYKLIKH